MPEITLRRATEEDVPLILEFIRALANYENELDNVTATPETLREHLFGDPPKARVVFAEMDGEALGFAVYFYFFATYRGKPGIYLEDIFVKPEARGRGVGKALFRFLVREVKEAGGDFLRWWVADFNHSGIAFYESLGARREDSHFIYHLEDEKMDRLLD